jgi:hypothetical protein
MEWIKKTSNKQLSTLEPKESVGVTATLCVDFILPAKTSARTNMAVPSIQLPFFSSSDLLPVIVKKYLLIIIF